MGVYLTVQVDDLLAYLVAADIQINVERVGEILRLNLQTALILLIGLLLVKSYPCQVVVGVLIQVDEVKIVLDQLRGGEAAASGQQPHAQHCRQHDCYNFCLLHVLSSFLYVQAVKPDPFP